MTWEELNKVRDLTKELKETERTLEILRASIAAKVPVLDGMPKPTSTDSRVETVALRIVELSEQADLLKNELAEIVPALKSQISRSFTDKTARKLFILRYVDCMYFRDIAFILGYSETHVYYLHKIFLKNLIVDSDDFS